MLKPYALRLPTATATATRTLNTLRTVLCGALYTACVDASRTVFWDRSRMSFSYNKYNFINTICIIQFIDNEIAPQK